MDSLSSLGRQISVFAMAIYEYSFICNLVVSDEDGDNMQVFL